MPVTQLEPPPTFPHLENQVLFSHLENQVLFPLLKIRNFFPVILLSWSSALSLLRVSLTEILFPACQAG